MPQRTNVEKLYFDSNILFLNHVYCYNIGIFIYKFSKNMLPELFKHFSIIWILFCLQWIPCHRLLLMCLKWDILGNVWAIMICFVNFFIVTYIYILLRLFVYYINFSNVYCCYYCIMRHTMHVITSCVLNKMIPRRLRVDHHFSVIITNICNLCCNLQHPSNENSFCNR